MEDKKPIINAFICKHIFLYHGFIMVRHPLGGNFYTDDVKEVTIKADQMVVVHGVTKKHVIHKVKKYLLKNNLLSKEKQNECSK